METVCIKLEDTMLKKMRASMKEKGYGTTTEYVREAIRDKLEEDERKQLINEFLALKGAAKKKTTGKENQKVRESVLRELIKEKGWK